MNDDYVPEETVDHWVNVLEVEMLGDSVYLAEMLKGLSPKAQACMFEAASTLLKETL